MTNNPQPHNSTQIRKLLSTIFDDPGLDAFCQDYFYEVYNRFGRGMRKDEKVNLLLDHCLRFQTGFEQLLHAVRSEYEANRAQRDELKAFIEAIEALSITISYPLLNYYRSEIADIINYYNETFVSRPQVWTQLASFAGQAEPGYLLVEAPAGYGKSALLAYLVKRHEDGQWEHSPLPNLLYFFIRQEGQRNTPTAFLRALNVQLLALLKLPDELSSDLDDLRDQFSRFWSQALATAGPAKPLLLLVDSLDEMAAGKVTIVDLLPGDLTPYAHIIISSRPQPEHSQQVDFRHPFAQPKVLRLSTFTEIEIQALLREYGATTNLATTLAPRVLAITKGEPLFARFVCQEVVAEGEAALIRLERGPPAGVEAYFRQQFRQLDALAEGDLIWNVLGLLVVTLGGITFEEIADVLTVGKRKVRQAVKPIRRFLLGQNRLELMHVQFRKVVADEFSQQEQNKRLRKLLTWCRRFQEQDWPSETPEYILAYYTRHLNAAGRFEDLCELVESQAWTLAKYIDTPWVGSLIEDLQLSSRIARGENVESLARSMGFQLRRALIEKLMSMISYNAILFLVKLGYIDQALDLARRHRWRQFNLIREIARITASTEPNKAANILVELAHAADDQSPLDQCTYRLAIAQEILQLLPAFRTKALNLISEAKSLEYAIPEAKLTKYKVEWSLPVLALSGDVDAAMQASNALSELEQAQVWRYISITLPQGHPAKRLLADQALSALESLEQTPEVMNEKMKAIVTLLPFIDSNLQEEWLNSLVSIGNYIQSVGEPPRYEWTQSWVIRRVAQVNLDWAKYMLLESDWVGASGAWSKVVREIAKLDYKDALYLLSNRFANYAGCSEALTDIIRMVSVDRGDVKEAETLIGEYVEQLRRDLPEAYLALAEGYLARGYRSKAQKIFREQVLVVDNEVSARTRDDLQLAILRRVGVFLPVEDVLERLIDFHSDDREKKEEAQYISSLMAARQGKIGFLKEYYNRKAQTGIAYELARCVSPEAAKRYAKSQGIEPWTEKGPEVYAHIAIVEAQEDPIKLEVFLEHFNTNDDGQRHHFCSYMTAFPHALGSLVWADRIESVQAKQIIEDIYPQLIDWRCPCEGQSPPHDLGERQCACYDRKDEVLAHLIGIMAKLDPNRAEQMVDSLLDQPVKVSTLKQILYHTQADEALVNKIIDITPKVFEDPLHQAASHYHLATLLPAKMTSLIGKLIGLAEPLLGDRHLPTELKLRKGEALMMLVNGVNQFDNISKSLEAIEDLLLLDIRNSGKLRVLDVLAERAVEWSEQDKLALLQYMWRLATTRDLLDVQAFIAFSIPIINSLDGEEGFWHLYDCVEQAYQGLL